LSPIKHAPSVVYVPQQQQQPLGMPMPVSPSQMYSYASAPHAAQVHYPSLNCSYLFNMMIRIAILELLFFFFFLFIIEFVLFFVQVAPTEMYPNQMYQLVQNQQIGFYYAVCFF
jgi:hypothetical protein